MRKTLSLAAVFAVAIFATTLFADSVVEEIIARVNDDIITRAELARNRQQLQDEAKQKGAPLSNEQMAVRKRPAPRSDRPATPDPKSQRPWYHRGHGSGEEARPDPPGHEAEL